MKRRGLFFEHIHKILANINHICHVYSHNILVSVFWGHRFALIDTGAIEI